MAAVVKAVVMTRGPQVIGVDEISIRKGHTYRIVVSDPSWHRSGRARTARWLT